MTEYEKAEIRMYIKRFKKIGKENAEIHFQKWVEFWENNHIKVNQSIVKLAVKKWLQHNPQYNF